MYYSAIGLLAVIILLIENQDILFMAGDFFDIPAWKEYRRFLFAVLFYNVTDILWGVIESYKMAALLFADTTLYYVAMAVGLLLWTQYTVSFLDENNLFSRILSSAGGIIASLITLLNVINVFKPVLFIVDSDCVYTPLPARYVMLTSQIILLMVLAIYAFTSIYRKRDALGKGRRYRTLAFFGIIMAFFLSAQLWFPYLPLYAIAYMLGTCLLHTYVLNDEKEEYRRDLEEAAKSEKLKDTILSLLNNMPVMAFTKDASTGVYLACNQSFAEYAHKDSPGGVVGLTDFEMFDHETARHSVADDSMAMSMDEPYIFFEDVLDAAGNERQLQTTKLKYKDTQGRQCVLGICQDVTDMVRIQRENALTKEAYEKVRSMGIIYNHIAQTLARGYADLYYVNLDSEEFIEYRTDNEGGSLTEERRGDHFFEKCKEDVEKFVHEEDRETVIRALDKKTLEAALDQNLTFVMTYRLLRDNGSFYVTMKVSRMEDDDRNIIMGVTDVDEQVRQSRQAERMREEEIAYARINALTGDFLCIYVVDPESGFYREFSSSAKYEFFAQAKEGRDFFNTCIEASKEFVYPEDRQRFLTSFTRDSVLSDIGNNGIYTLIYRIMREDKPFYVQLKAALVEEREGSRLIVGILDIDSQVRQEEAYARDLTQAQIEASIDALTGVKNRHSFLLAEERLNAQIAEGKAPGFAIVIMDVNDLKVINDTKGHAAGDQYLKDACRLVCETFRHSPVYRIGGDEFAVISQGSDYERIEELVAAVNDHNLKAVRNGGIVVACGMAKHGDEKNVAPVFEKADQNMYLNKSELKK